MSSASITISEKLREVEQLFSKKSIPTPRLDAEVLLAYALGVKRAWLHAHGESELVSKQVGKFESFVQRRLKREPVAYITGKKEFYGREFIVTSEVLIPRPETEDLVELVSEQVSKLVSIQKGSTFLDIGCGSGCIGITVKLEHPSLDVTLSDISPKALAVAKENAKQLGANVNFVESDLLSSFASPKIQNPKSKIHFDIIVANLPYVDKTWEASPETAFEPALALFAENSGLALIDQLLPQAANCLKPGGHLLLEADPEQHKRIIEHAKQAGFQHLKTSGYAMSFVRQASL